MTLLRELFEKDIDRNINGVVKVEQVNDEDLLFQELSEFVVTKELAKHFKTFYTNYCNSLDERTDKMGVWISGFFGSGKSHFLKMLSYLLENQTVNGKEAVAYFADKDLEDFVFADIKRASKIPTETILFNIDSKSSSNTKQKKDGIVEVFLKVFNEKLGYSSEYPRLANIERYLDKIGKYEDFKNTICSSTGLTWQEAVDGVEFYKDAFVETYQNLCECSNQQASDLFANIVESFDITPEGFAKLIKEYLDSKVTKNRIIFLVDEIGQFISDNTNLMLNLQTVVENLGSMCGGRAWVLVTSQEAIDTITKGRFKDQDFSKIQGRFDTKLSLSGANTDEVIKKRLLEKKDFAKQTLEQIFNEQEKILDNLITFSSQTSGMKIYENKDDFIDCYPFVPYQFKLLQNVFASLRNFSHAGAHLSQNERSMLNAFHTALKEYGDKELKELVPFNIFYSTIKTFIDTDIVRIIEQSQEGNNDIDDFDKEVLIVLFLIKYIKEVPCDIENLATLMISNIDESKNALKSKIESALTRLKRANLIQQNGDIYDFLTNEEQDVSRGIANTEIDSGEVLNEVYRTIYEEIISTKSVTPIKGHTYYFVRRVDDIVRGTQSEDMEVKFITSMNPDYQFDDTSLKMKFSYENQLYIKLKDNGYLKELETVLKTEKYIKQKSGVKQTEVQNRIITNKGNEVLERKKRVKTLIEQAIIESTFFSAGQILDLTTNSVTAKVEEALKIVVENTYTKLHFVKEHANNETEIYKRLNSGQEKLSDPNEQARKDVDNYLQIQNQMNMSTTMQNIVTRYTKRPYGWAELDIAGLVADLVATNKVQMFFNGAVIQPNEREAVDFLTNDKKISKVEIKVKAQIDSAIIQQIWTISRDLFEMQDLSDDGEKLANQVKDEMTKLVDGLRDLKSKYTNDEYPDKQTVEIGIETFNNLKSELDVKTFFDKLINKDENLKEWKSSYKLVKSFFGSQKPIFDEALRVASLYDRNAVYVDNAELKEISEQIKGILSNPKPYSNIKDLPALKEQFNNKYNELLNEFKSKINTEIEKLNALVNEEASKLGVDSEKYSELFRNNVLNSLGNTNEFGELKALKEKADNYCNTLLKQINDDANRKAQECVVENNYNATADDTQIQTQPVIQTKELEFVKTSELIDTGKTLETEEDVDALINKLSCELKSKIRNNKRIKLS